MTPHESLRADAHARLADLYDEFLPVVYGYARSRLPTADAEDLTAEVFRSAAETLRSDPAARLHRGWFLTAVRNRVIDRWRRRIRLQDRLTSLEREAEARTIEPPSTEPEDRVVDALDRLSPAHHAVLILRYVDDQPIRKIAETLGRSPSATDSLLARARRELIAAFEEVAS